MVKRQARRADKVDASSPFLPVQVQRSKAKHARQKKQQLRRSKMSPRHELSKPRVSVTSSSTSSTIIKVDDAHATTKTALVATQTTTSSTVVPVVERRIEKDEIAQLPPMAWQGPVHVLWDRTSMQAAVKRLLQDETILGFDTETKPCFRKGQYEPPALVQIAGRHAVYIFQVLRENGLLNVLVPLFEAAHVLKVGVSIKQDVKELQRQVKFSPAGFVELSDRTRKLGYQQTGLRALTAMMMGGNLSKKQQMSNWAKPVLTHAQIQYAATDAWVGREIYLKVLQEEEEQQKNVVMAAKNS